MVSVPGSTVTAAAVVAAPAVSRAPVAAARATVRRRRMAVSLSVRSCALAIVTAAALGFVGLVARSTTAYGWRCRLRVHTGEPGAVRGRAWSSCAS
ncbi:hypothetical protein GCM10023237_67490 [Streptomyces coeruleoprunus]